MRLKLKALAQELQCSEEQAEQQAACLVTLLPGLERTFMGRQVKLLAELARHQANIPSRMVRPTGMAQPQRSRTPPNGTCSFISSVLFPNLGYTEFICVA